MPDISEMLEYLKNYDGREAVLMEVCGTHTAAISENGIPALLSPKIKLVSGPGCPVCVTVSAYIDRLIELAKQPGYCVVTFGDMLRVRGSRQSLREAGAEGAKYRMVYSPFEMLKLAEEEPETTFVFAAVGFETTTPVYAVLLEEASEAGLKNIRLLTSLKTMPEVIRTVCGQGSRVTGFIAPGHVSVITGSSVYKPLAEEFGIPFVVSGFEGGELISAIYMLMKLQGKGEVKNMYPQAVNEEKNEAACKLTDKYFEKCSASWRGLGSIPESGLRLRNEYAGFDAGSDGLDFDSAFNAGCSCGDVVSGRISPNECPLFGRICTPGNPQGACMVSSEGSCYHYYINKRV